MVEMALWSKISSFSSTTSSTTISDHHHHHQQQQNNASSSYSSSSSSSSSSCCGLSRLIRKLKKQKRMLCPSTSRQSSFQCRYDPMSYSLNFDTSGASGSSILDDDYYKFCAFSSRFVARSDCQRPVATSH